MRRILQFAAVMILSTVSAFAQCDYTVDMYDSYGDGWNGNTITVDNNGTTSSQTLSGGSFGSFTVSVNTGDSLKITWNAGGSFTSEVTFNVVNADGNVIYSSPQGNLMTAGTVVFAHQVTCPSLLTPTLDGFTAFPTEVSVDLTFRGTATDFDLEIGTAGFAQGSGISYTSTTSPILATGLASGTLHDFYYRSRNATDTSAWVGPVNFRTPCSAVTAYPFAENFDGSTWAQNGSSWSPNSSYDSCWTANPTSGHSWQVQISSPSTTRGPAQDASGSGQYVYTHNSSSSPQQAYLTLPYLDLSSLTTPELSFAYFMYGTSINGMYVEASVDTGNTWVVLDSIIGLQQTSQSDFWQELFVDLSSVNTSFTMLRFRGEYGGFSGDIAIDEVLIQDQPACPKPFAASFSGHRATEVTMHWKSNSSSDYVVEWGPRGYLQGTGLQLTVTDTFAVITGLAADTEYDFYVYADCSASVNGTSDLAGPFGTRTLIAPYHLFTIDNFLPDNRWYEFDGVLTDSVHTFNSTWSNWNQDGFLQNGFSGAVGISFGTGSWSIPLHEWFVTPRIDLDSSMTYQMTFDAGMSDGTGSTAGDFEPTDTMFVVVSTDAGETWSRSNVAFTMHDGNNPGNSTNTYAVDLSAYTNVVRVGFYLKKTVVHPVTEYLTIDNIRFETIPACTNPNTFSGNYSGLDSVSFAWNGDSTASHMIEYGPCGFTQGSGMFDSISTGLSMGIGGLTASTCYDIYIQADCGTSQSAWAGPFTIYTACDTLNTPFVESFESAISPDLMPCWGKQSFSANYFSVATGTSGAFPGSRTGVNYLNFNNSWGSDVWVFTPEVQMYSDSAYIFSFWYQTATGSNVTELRAALGQGQTPVDMQYTLYTTAGANATTYTLVEAQFIPPADGVYNLGILVDQSGSGSQVNIDDIGLRADTSACAAPSFPSSQVVNSNEVNIQWASAINTGNVDVEWGPIGFNPGTGNAYGTVSVAGDSLNIDTLQSNTCYQFYVKASCNPSNNDWIGPFQFCTPCDATNMPYAEDFNSWPPNCVDINVTGRPWQQSNGTWATANFYSVNDDFMAMKMRNVNITGQARVRFKWSSHYFTFYPNDEMNLLARPTGQATWDTIWHAKGATLNSNDGATSTQPGSGVQELFVLPASYIGQEVEFQFDGFSDWGPHVFIDDFIVDSLPSCPEPISVSNYAGTETSASGTVWFVDGGAANFNLAYGPAASTTTPSQGMMMNATNDTVTITGLLDATTYNVWVRDSCAPGDVSVWTGPTQFTTKCLPLNIPYYEGFSAWPPACMDVDQGQSPWMSYNGWAEANFYSNNDADYDMTTPYLILSDSAELSFKWSSHALTFYPYDSVQVRVREINGPWTTLWSRAGDSLNSFDGANNGAPGSGITEFLDIDFGAGDTVQIGFFAHSDWGPDLFIDDINVYERPACDAPSAFAASAASDTSATVTWEAGSAGATTWWVEYGPAGFQAGSGTSVQVSNDTATITGLLPATEYCFYVTEICPNSGDSSATIGQVCMVTDCPINGYLAPYFTDLEILTPGVSQTGQLDNCWSFNNPSFARWETEDAEGVNENSSATGPLYDHTTPGVAGGMYVFMETSSGSQGDTAVFSSPWVDVSAVTNPGVDYWYFMYGATMGSLKVQVRDNASGSQWVTIDTIVGQQQTAQTDPWLNHKVSFPASIGSTVQVRFIAARGSSYTGDVSLDDIFIGQVSACNVTVTGLATGNVACTSMDVSWTSPAAGSFIEYGPAGFTPGSGTSAYAASPYSITNLTPGTAYDVYVGDTCGGDTLYAPVVMDTTDNGPLPTLNISDVQDSVGATVAIYTFDAGATNATSISWDFGNGVTDTGMVSTQTFNTNDSVSVTVTASNDCGDTTATYWYVVSGISVEEVAFLGNLAIYPNPSTGFVTMQLDMPEASEIEFTLINGLGQPVMTESLGRTQSFNGQFDLSTLPKGVYFVRITTEHTSSTQRIVLQ
ncbi:fibronectin type III domain-containing protein [Phaeocystidibacter luteus]|uniref:T9SS type A sorting domain-containing protein n=1 Tax=Phaeocystidibacter luteus TaxID=911197 RepID=A0A6N6RFI2_9FLAO|nr:fibronectin type III domain-containing protein [Phaeocystidibacter luteus]KAB2805442.1 T9SS type A sorting domain-containing protein [Phaeocystidibacter luteus]